MKRLWRNKNNRWLVALVLGLSLVWLSFDDVIVDTVQSWRYDSTQEQLTAESSGQSGLMESKAANEEKAVQQKSPEVLQQGSGLSDRKYNDLLVAASKNNPPEKFFAEYRLERERVRGQQVEWLREVVDNPKSADENRKEAQKRLIAITENLSKELLLENMLKAKNYQDAIVFMQTGNVTIIVQSQELTPQDITKITDLVSRTTGRSAQEMVIIPKK